ncbi:MAG: toprim domain-containing protein [Methylococcaceae bacterium]|nr:toprim domain-containing protein [Methylococcaceae bacterium]
MTQFVVINQFKSAMLETIGAAPENIVADGLLHRFKIDGKLNGAYCLHLDGKPAGYFEDFKQGIKTNWKSSVGFIPLSDFQKQQHAKKRLEDEAKRQAEGAAKHQAAALKAASIWQASTPADANHPYLIAKRIKPHGARQLGSDQALIIPIYNAKQELVNVQYIARDGAKRFLYGAKKRACFSVIGDHNHGDKFLICEGFATGASLHENSGYAVVVALDAGNLEPVAKEIKALYSTAEIIIAGDNDLSGVGQKAAEAAALAIGAKYILPPVSGQDFNDALNSEVTL